MKEEGDSYLSIKDTNVLKGIALLLLLIHHLFYLNNGLYDDIPIWKNRYVVQEIGIMAKVCVAIFVLLSGYGLTISTVKNGGIPNLKTFYIHRFKKLFLNYWFIWCLFVPISIFVFNYTFKDAYHDHIAVHLIADIAGLHAIIFTDTYCYNPTWWFYSCIILLYILFPLLYKWVRSDVISVLLVAMAISFLPIPYIDVIRFNLLAFILGIIFVVRKLPPPSNSRIFPLLILLLLMVERNYTKYPIFTDCLISASLVQFYRSFTLSRPIKQVLAFIGKHSMNIFLFHTFIFYFWFKEYIYATRMPIVIFLFLLVVCIVISVVLEWVKKTTINKLL